MTCSSNTTSTPRRFALAATLALAAIVPAAADAGRAERLIAAAQAALARKDGISAQARLREARSAGASEDAVRAGLGEALLEQGDLVQARHWLEPARFTAATRAQGFWTLGRLELREGRLPEAGAALDRALAIAPRDPRMWTDIARLRLAGGERAQAIAAVDHALELDPREPGALGLRGALLREQVGLAAALPWFDAALARAPDSAALLLDRAATLGDLGRAADALRDARRAPGEPRALYLQAVIAARAGQGAFARRLLERGGAQLRDRPGAMLLAGALALDAGDVNLAIGQLERLLQRQPDNLPAQLLLARAFARSGDARALIERFAGLARRGDAPPYLLVLVARAYEETGRRGEAMPLLARAAESRSPAAAILPSNPSAGERDAPSLVAEVRALLAAGRGEQAATVAERMVKALPGSPDARLLAGDVELARNRPDAALDHYREAAATRFGEAELARTERALRLAGRAGDADRLLYAFAAQNPRSLVGLRLLANAYARNGRWAESERLLAWIGARRGMRDPDLLADLAFAKLSQGRRAEAARLARAAMSLQPTSANAREVLRRATNSSRD